MCVGEFAQFWLVKKQHCISIAKKTVIFHYIPIISPSKTVDGFEILHRLVDGIRIPL